MPEADLTTATPRPGGWLETSDHRRVGLLYLYTSVAFLVAGSVAGMILRAELAEPGNQILRTGYGAIFSMHSTVLTALFLAPAWVGLATAIVPLQIGANRLAFPRAQTFAFWTYLMGGLVVLAAYVLPDLHLTGLGLNVPPTRIPGGGSAADDLWIAGMILVTVASVLASINLVVTVATLRAPGMRFDRVPLFSWSALVTGGATILAAPLLLAGLVLLYIDVHFGGRFFSSPGSGLAWQHTLWLYGRPEIYLLLLPGLGAASDIVASSARRPLVGIQIAQGDIVAFGALSFMCFAAGNHVLRALVLPTYTVATALVALPVAGLVAVWLATLFRGRPRITPALLCVAAAAALLGLAALNAAIAGLVGVNGTAWTTGFLHLAAFGPPTLLVVGATVHWAPKLWAASIGAALPVVTTLLLFGGFLTMGGASLLLGYNRLPWHVVDGTGSTWTTYSRMAAAGGLVILLGVISFGALVARAAVVGRYPEATDDPDALTLEWMVPAVGAGPNFETVPPVRSAQPLADARVPAGVSEE